jgi:aminoglycoside/choline kinase family phosphotransferase
VLVEKWFDDENFVITSASDDASFRRYFRVERNNNTLIAMDALPEKEDSTAFIKIATLLRTNNLHVVKPDSLIFKWQARALSKAKSRVMPERI